MVSVDGTKWVSDSKVKFSFCGLEGDVKPVGSYEGKLIANGSTFLVMSATPAVKFYDEQNGAWV